RAADLGRRRGDALVFRGAALGTRAQLLHAGRGAAASERLAHGLPPLRSALGRASHGARSRPARRRGGEPGGGPEGAAFLRRLLDVSDLTDGGGDTMLHRVPYP